jgi:hypothetical protein
LRQPSSSQAQKHDDGATVPGAAYDSEFCSFVVSILWRVSVSRFDELHEHYPRFEVALTSAIQTWKDFLDGKRKDLGDHPAYFLFLDEAAARKVFEYHEEARPNDGPAPVLHRYFVNSINTQLVVYNHDGYALTWAMGNSWLMVGVIAISKEEPKGSDIELSPTGGVFAGPSFAVPPIVLATLRRQSWGYLNEHKQISAKQRQKISEIAAKKSPNFNDQSQQRAMQADLAMFGPSAEIRKARQHGKAP